MELVEQLKANIQSIQEEISPLDARREELEARGEKLSKTEDDQLANLNTRLNGFKYELDRAENPEPAKSRWDDNGGS